MAPKRYNGACVRMEAGPCSRCEKGVKYGISGIFTSAFKKAKLPRLPVKPIMMESFKRRSGFVKMVAVGITILFICAACSGSGGFSNMTDTGKGGILGGAGGAALGAIMYHWQSSGGCTDRGSSLSPHRRRCGAFHE